MPSDSNVLRARRYALCIHALRLPFKSPVGNRGHRAAAVPPHRRTGARHRLERRDVGLPVVGVKAGVKVLNSSLRLCVVSLCVYVQLHGGVPATIRQTTRLEIAPKLAKTATRHRGTNKGGGLGCA